MNSNSTCLRCGAAQTSDGLCPRCELAVALETSSAAAAPEISAASEGSTLKRFGDYELLQEIGHGGMGVVYKARHLKLNRVVALKLLLLGQFSSEAAVKRFQREAQAAASLRHSNLIALYDVGEIDGQHYFTMEFVEGRSLAALLRDSALPPRQAAAYCRAIAEAMSAAHNAGIIHRDLKPSNILIDAFDQPRITDFGLAKRLDGSSSITLTGQMLGSPNYLAPELAAGQEKKASPATDIFSIGAMLYECLTGRPPFVAATLPETLLRIRDTEPVAPRVLNAQIPRDLETICLKCLEKEPAKRYATAQELADDLGRFLNDEPIHARPVTRVERAWRWCRRKPARATSFFLILILLLIVIIGSPIAVFQINQERRRAEAALRKAEAQEKEAKTEATKNEQVVQFFEEMLAGAGPEVAKGRDATILKEILNQTSQRIGTELTNQPEVEAYLRESIGKVYQDLGDYTAAEQMQRQVLAFQRQLHPGGHRDVAKALHDLAASVTQQGRLAEAESLAREALELGKKFPSPFPEDVPAQMNNLATILRSEAKYADAEAIHREALALNRKVLGNEHREVAVTLGNLAIALGRQNKFAEAEAALREALDLCKKLFGNDNPLSAQSLTTLTIILMSQNKLVEAETTGREAIAMQKRLLGEEHPNVATAIGNLATVLERADNLPEAESLRRQQLALRRKALGNEHPLVVQSLLRLGVLLSKRDNLAEAEATLRDCLDVTKKLPPNEYVDLEDVYFELVKVLTAEGKTDEAQKFFDEAQPLRKDLKK